MRLALIGIGANRFFAAGTMRDQGRQVCQGTQSVPT